MLRDAPRLCRVAPQHEGMLLMKLRKMPHPEVPREARPRRTQDIPPALPHSCPASSLFRPTFAGRVRRDAKRRGDGHPAHSGRGRSLNQLQSLLDPSHAAIEIVLTHGQTTVIVMQSGYLAREHRFTAREDRFSAMEERFAVQDERMSAMPAVIVCVAERLDGTPRPHPVRVTSA